MPKKPTPRAAKKAPARPPQQKPKEELTEEQHEERGEMEKYGRWWPALPLLVARCGGVLPDPIYRQMGLEIRKQWQSFYIEKIILSSVIPNPDKRQCPGTGDIKKFAGFMGWEHHFKEMVSILFGGKDSRWTFEWNPNAERMLKEFWNNRFLSIVGCASSGKSRFLAALALGMFLIDPLGTKIVVTSKTLQTAEGKIWGDISEAWSQLTYFFGDERLLPGRKMANGLIRAECHGQKTHKAGLQLIAGEKSAAKKNAEKLQGYKRHMVLLLADELDTAESNIITTAQYNLSSGNTNFHMVGAMNPTGRFTPGGIFSKPVAGWDSITEEDYEWETELGKAIRFNAELSPNVIEGKEIWKGLMTRERLAKEIEKYGGNKTAGYYSQVLGWFPPAGEADSIYSEMEIIEYKADCPVTTWIDVPTPIVGLDIGYAHGGDRTMAAFCNVGRYRRLDGVVAKVCELVKMLRIDEDMTDKVTNKSVQIVKKFAAECRLRGIEIKNIAIDASAGGDVFAGLLGQELGTGFLCVKFASSPSETAVSNNDRRPGKERFVRKVDELWYVGKELIRQGQIRGIDADTITEMCARTYKDEAGKVKIESKEKMKLRTSGISPDRADAFFICLDLARQRHGLASTEKPLKKPKTERTAPSLYQEIQEHSSRRKVFPRFAKMYW